MYVSGGGGFKSVDNWGKPEQAPHWRVVDYPRMRIQWWWWSGRSCVRAARKHLRYVGNVFTFKLYGIQYHVRVRNSLAVSHRRLMGRTREKDYIWSSRAAEEPKARQARLERKRACSRVRRTAEQPGARQTRLERRRGRDRMNNRAETRPARLERQCKGIRNRRAADLVFLLSASTKPTAAS